MSNRKKTQKVVEWTLYQSSLSFQICKYVRLPLRCPQGGTPCLLIQKALDGLMFCFCRYLDFDISEKLEYFQKPCSGMWSVGNYNKIQWFVKTSYSQKKAPVTFYFD